MDVHRDKLVIYQSCAETGCLHAGSNPASHNLPMYLKNFSLSIKAESKEEALQKIEENLEDDDVDYFKLKVSPDIDELVFNSNEAVLRTTFYSDEIWQSIELGFAANQEDSELAKNIYETLHQPLENQALSFKPDDRGRITLGSNFADRDEVQVIVLE